MLESTVKSNIRCPNCGSRGWYRKVTGEYACKKCATNFTVEDSIAKPVSEKSIAEGLTAN